MNMTRLFSFLIAVSLVLFFLLRPTGTSVHTEHLGKDAVVLAFGDSLTYGYGAVAQAYPTQLQTLIGRRVVNAGVSGEVSVTGLKRLPKLLERYRPSLVILCHGGNDILRRYSKEALKANLIKMIELSHQSGAEVLLVGVPGFGLLGLSTVPLYEEVSLAQNVLYEGNILEKIESDNSLKSDQIHPNALGYGLMAEAFAAVLRENGVL
ncbi:MAG: arylesterase [Helicobacteraceae bacterium]|jgi:acyl-CoA thioesterase-1|nr:arylesterase [Helicobacteraceae bacterium]